MAKKEEGPKTPGSEEIQITPQLVNAAQRGEEGALDRLSHAISSRAHDITSRMMCNPHDAEEVAQEASIRAIGALGKYEGRARFTSWLHRIIINSAKSHVERHARHSALSLEEHQEVNEKGAAGKPREQKGDERPIFERVREIEDTVIERTEAEEIRAVIEKLSPKLKEVVFLHYYTGMTHAGIAEALGISEGASRKRLQEAHKKLRGMVFLTEDDEITTED